ncbi:MAG: DegV family protein [Halanaerobiales bacterium]|nr:DegV family protein [Halanaerobiales bacterium]
MSVKIIADTACDLPEEMIKNYEIITAPLLVYLEGHEDQAEKNDDPKIIYDGMRDGKVYKTAQVPPNYFEKIFKKLAEENQEAIYIAFSSELSGTYQASVVVKNKIDEEYGNFDLDIIDSRCASLGYGLVVYKAAKMAQEGKSKEEILNVIEHDKEHMEHIFTVDNLKYLRRGGRVSRTAAFVGGLLNIKPILDVQDGKLEPLEEKRGRNKVLDRIIEIMEERGNNLEQQIIGISHGDDLEGAKKLKQMIQNKFKPKGYIINMIGSVIGAHSGPGTLGIYFLNDTNY